MSTLALCVLASSLSRAPAGAAPIKDNQDVFNGYAMQAPLSQSPSLKVLKTWSAEFVKEVGVYENPGEVLTLNGVSFLMVRYRFADQRLESIQLVYPGRDNREKLVQWLEAQYGKLSSAERKMVSQVEWRGDNMTITLSYNFSHEQGTLWFVSNELNHLLSDSIASLPD